MDDHPAPDPGAPLAAAADAAAPGAGPEVARTLDCRGERCPLPVIRLGREIASVAVGECLAVAATDPAARADIPAWCRMRGQEYVGESAAEDGTPVYVVRRRS